jgi:hypothetical protein
LSAANRHYAAKTALVIFGAFTLLSLPLIKAGRTESPAKTALRQLGKAPAIAVVGDSRAHAAIAPRLLKRAFEHAGVPGADGYNFAVDGTDLLHHRSFVVNALLGGTSRPKVLIWAPNPLSFDGSRTQNLLEQLELRDVPPLTRAGAPLELLLDVLTMKLFPAYGHRPVIQSKTVQITDAAAAKLLRVQQTVGYTLEQPSGTRVFTAYPDGHKPFHVVGNWRVRFDRVARVYAADYEKLRVSDWHFALARDLIRRVRDAGITLVVIELPVAPAYREKFASTPKHQAWRERLRRLVIDEGAIWLSHVDRYPSDTSFNDPAHMHDETAEDYTRFLAEELLRLPTVVSSLRAN